MQNEVSNGSKLIAVPNHGSSDRAPIRLKLICTVLLPALLSIGSTFALPDAAAETVYITDVLRLGMHESPTSTEKAFRILVSGDALEVLERIESHARVRTSNGDEGWVKLSYLVTEKPSQALLLDLNLERDQLKSELDILRAQQSDHEALLNDIRSDRDVLEETVTATSSEIQSLQQERIALSDQLKSQQFSVPVLWLLIVAIATLFGGFALGWWWTDARQRARHGGYRI